MLLGMQLRKDFLTMGYGAESNQRILAWACLETQKQSLSSIFTEAQRTRNGAETSGYSCGATRMDVQGWEGPGGAQPEDIPKKRLDQGEEDFGNRAPSWSQR